PEIYTLSLHDALPISIKKLSLNERMVVVLFYVKEYSQSEISAFLDVPLTTVAKRLYSAKARLRAMMLDEFKNDLTVHRPSRNKRDRKSTRLNSSHLVI